jgi:KDO2-lipid IV(A) lauroyltransferase
LPISFFGKRVSASGAVALLARRYDVPVIPLFCVRKPDGSMALLVYPPVPMQQTLDARADLVANTQRVTDIIENVIKQYPEQWFWAHKRWKKHYPHLYPDLAARERRRAIKRLNASSTQ